MKAAGKKTMFHVPKPNQTQITGETEYQAQFRTKLLAFIVKSNLAFRLVEQPEFRDLLQHLNPIIKSISATTLKRDLRHAWEDGQKQKKEELLVHVEARGRVSGMRRLNTCTRCILRTCSTLRSICRAKIESPTAARRDFPLF
jgi:hypothetical protein